MSAGPIIIDSAQRRVLYHLVAERLARADLVYLSLANGLAAEAESDAIELGQDLDLMHQIGWDPEDGRESYLLSLAPADLIETLERYAKEAELSIFQVGITYGFDNADSASVACSARVCRDLIGSLDERSQIVSVTVGQRDELHWLLTASLFRRDASEGSVDSFMQDMRLMIGLGWLDREQMEALGWPEGSMGSLDLALPVPELSSALRRLADLARQGIETERTDDPSQSLRERRARFARAARLCEELLDRLKSPTKGGAE
jgi:hypothetical protein